MKTCIFAAGRFNPPHKGHAGLFSQVKELAELHHANHLIGVGNAWDKNNPIQPSTKITYLKTLFPEINFVLLDNNNPSFFHLIFNLYKEGIEHLILVVGSDRAKFYKDEMLSLNGQSNLFYFKKISMISLARKTHTQEESYMSSTQLRKLVYENDFEEFFSMVPPKMSEALAREIFNGIRKRWMN